MNIKYYIQKAIGSLFDIPLIPSGKTIGYSLVKSERVNVIVGKYTRITPPFFLHHIELGDYSYISKNASINKCIIGRFCSIGPNFCCGLGIHPTNGISTSPMFYSSAKQNGITLCDENKVEESKETRIGNDVFIGANVTVLDGVSIGDGAVIGAGAVVTKDIPPYAIVGGVPAKIIRYRFNDTTISKLQEKQWWDKDEKELERVEHFFWSVTDYLDL